MPKIQSSKGAFEGSLKGSCCVSKIDYPLLEQADSTELRYHPCATEIRIYSYNYRSSDLILGDFKRDWIENDDSSTQLPGISDSGRSTTAPLPVVDRQQPPPVGGYGRAYTHRNTHGSHTLSNWLAPRLNDTSPVLNHFTCPPALRGAGACGASAQGSFFSAPERSMPPSSLPRQLHRCRSPSPQHRLAV